MGVRRGSRVHERRSKASRVATSKVCVATPPASTITCGSSTRAMACAAAASAAAVSETALRAMTSPAAAASI
eukprot:4438206-Prymnesium_polylepis.1